MVVVRVVLVVTFFQADDVVVLMWGRGIADCVCGIYCVPLSR